MNSPFFHSGQYPGQYPVSIRSVCKTHTLPRGQGLSNIIGFSLPRSIPLLHLLADYEPIQHIMIEAPDPELNEQKP